MTRPSGARWSSPGLVGSIQVRSVTSKTGSRWLEAVSSGPNSRKVRCGGVGGDDVAQPGAQDAGRFVQCLAGLGDRHGVSRRSAAGPGNGSRCRRWRAGWRRCARRRPGRRSGRRAWAGRSGRRVRRAGRTSSSRPACAGASGSPGRRPAAPGASGTCPRPARRPRCCGPVQPLGVRRMMTGQGGTPSWAAFGLRLVLWMRRMVASAESRASAILWCIVCGSSPEFVDSKTQRGSQPCAASRPSSCSRGIRSSTVGLAIL